MLALLIAVALFTTVTALARLRLAGWTSVIVGLAVFGGDPRDPLAAVLASAGARIGVRFLLSVVSRRRHRR